MGCYAAQPQQDSQPVEDNEEVKEGGKTHKGHRPAKHPPTITEQQQAIKDTITTIATNVLQLVPSNDEKTFKSMFDNIKSEVDSITDNNTLTALQTSIDNVSSSSSGISTAATTMSTISQLGTIASVAGTMMGNPELTAAGGCVAGLFGAIGSIFGCFTGNDGVATTITAELNTMLTAIESMLETQYIKELVDEAHSALGTINTVMSNVAVVADHAKDPGDWKASDVKTDFGYWDDSINGAQGTTIFAYFDKAASALSGIQDSYFVGTPPNQWNLGKGLAGLQGPAECFSNLMIWFCRLGVLLNCAQLSFQGMLARFAAEKGDAYTGPKNAYDSKLPTYATKLTALLNLGDTNAGFYSVIAYCFEQGSADYVMTENFCLSAGISESLIPKVSQYTAYDTSPPHRLLSNNGTAMVPYNGNGNANANWIWWQEWSTPQSGWQSVDWSYKQSKYMLLNTTWLNGWSYLDSSGNDTVNANVPWIVVQLDNGNVAYTVDTSHGTMWLAVGDVSNQAKSQMNGAPYFFY